MSKEDNIEKLAKLKELSRLKAEYHKKNALNYLPWNDEDEDDGVLSKIMQYGKMGFSAFQFFRSSTTNGENQSKGSL